MHPLLLTLALTTLSPPAALPYVDQVWLNPDLVSRFYRSPEHLVLATSAGLLFLDPETLQEVDRIPSGLDPSLPYPVVVDLQGIGDTLWLALWKHGVAVGIPTGLGYTFWSYQENPQVFPALNRVRRIALQDSFLVELTDTLVAVFHTHHTARPQDDPLVFYRFADVPPFTGVHRFLSVAASPETLYVGTDHGLYTAAWQDLQYGPWNRRFPDTTITALAWHQGRLAVGTDQGLWYQGEHYPPETWIGMVAFTGDTLYADPKDSLVSWLLRILPDGTQEDLFLPEGAGSDVRDVVALDGRVVYGLGYGDRPDPDWERYNIGHGLVMEQAGQWIHQDLEGPSVNRIVSLDWRDGTLWVVGSQPDRPYLYPVSRFRAGTWLTGTRRWIPTPRQLVALPAGALVSSWSSQGGLYVLDSLGNLIQHLEPPDPVVTALLPLGDQRGVIASYNGDLHHYDLAQNSLEYLGNVGGGGDAFPYSLWVDSRGRFWVGRVLGFTVYESLDHLDHFLFADEGQVPATVTAITEDAAGRIWLGTLNGVYVVEGQAVQSMAALPQEPVYDLAFAGGYVLVLTESRLAVYTTDWPPQPVVDLTTETGLPDVPRPDPLDNLYLFAPRHALALDSSGHVYVATNKGVARVHLGTAGGPPTSGGLRVYPNPLERGQNLFRVLGPSPLRWWGLYGLTGQRVSGLTAEETLPGVLQVEGSAALAPGLYVGVVQTGEGTVRTFKLAVVK